MHQGRDQIPRAAVIQAVDQIVRRPGVIRLLADQGRVIIDVSLFLAQGALADQTGHQCLDGRWLPALQALQGFPDLRDGQRVLRAPQKLHDLQFGTGDFPGDTVFDRF